MNALQDLIGLAGRESYPAEALEGARVVLLHDLSVALNARPLVADLLEEPYGTGAATDLATGGRIDLPSAVSRNGQLMHALTQDDTHLPAMTHVGATSIPLLLAVGETEAATLDDLLAGLAAAFAAAERLGMPVSAALSGKGIRPTPVIGPLAAVVGLGRMQRWEEARVVRAIGRVAASAFGTTQAWIDGSHEWLFEIASAGLLALAAARTSAKPWRSAKDPLWGEAGLFRCLGLQPEQDGTDIDHGTAVLRANVKRFPACAINQVPLALLQQATRGGPLPQSAEIRLQLSPPEANYPGVARQSGLDSWSARLMSLPYCAAVFVHRRNFQVADLEQPPADLPQDRIERFRVVPNERLQVGQYEVEVAAPGAAVARHEGSLQDVGRPARVELGHAAAAALGEAGTARLLGMLDAGSTAVADFLAGVSAVARERASS